MSGVSSKVLVCARKNCLGSRSRSPSGSDISRSFCRTQRSSIGKGHQSAYEREASMIYGYLREAWERGVEEVLLGGVVERYRPSVQTLKVAQIADITAEDCKSVETAMTKCSRWLPGHDQAAAARADIPDPPALKVDIEALENWVRAIHARRR